MSALPVPADVDQSRRSPPAFSTGAGCPRGDELVDAYGDVDEAVSALGTARAMCSDPPLAETLLRLQRELFAAADLAANPRQRARLASGVSLVTSAMTDDLEQTIDRLVADRRCARSSSFPAQRPSGRRSTSPAPWCGARNATSCAHRRPAARSARRCCATSTGSRTGCSSSPGTPQSTSRSPQPPVTAPERVSVRTTEGKQK